MLTPLDLVIIVGYLLGMVIVGIAYRGRQETADDYFTAGGGMSRLFGSILVGLSIAATFFSGISFLAYPSVIYQGQLGILLGIVGFPIAWLFLSAWFLPRYLSRGGQQPYELIERRFGYPVRAVAAGLFVLLRVGWMGALIYAPTMAIMSAGNLDERWFWPIVLAIGITSTVYTTFGGVRGVIVTDAVQFLIIIVGIALSIGFVLIKIPEPITDVWARLADAGRMQMFDFSFDLTRPMTVWSALIGVTIANLAMYVADQMSLQRYLAAGTVRASQRAFAVNVIGVIVVIILLALVGLCLMAWYETTAHARIAPDVADRVFPYFVASELPGGIAGAILAAILAATMSSMTSGINALAGTLTLDFYVKLSPGVSGRQQLSFARWTSFLVGLAATGIAGLVGRIGSIFDIAQTLTGVFLGPLLACMILTVTSRRIGAASLIAGIVLGCLAGWGICFSPIASLWVAPTAFAVSLFFPCLDMLLRRRQVVASADADAVVTMGSAVEPPSD